MIRKTIVTLAAAAALGAVTLARPSPRLVPGTETAPIIRAITDTTPISVRSGSTGRYSQAAGAGFPPASATARSGSVGSRRPRGAA